MATPVEAPSAPPIVAGPPRPSKARLRLIGLLVIVGSIFDLLAYFLIAIGLRSPIGGYSLIPFLATLWVGERLYKSARDDKLYVNFRVLSWLAKIATATYLGQLFLFLYTLIRLRTASHQLALTFSPSLQAQFALTALYLVGCALILVLLHQPDPRQDPRLEPSAGTPWTLFVPGRHLAWMLLGALLLAALGSAPVWIWNSYKQTADTVLSSSKVMDEVGRPQQMRLEAMPTNLDMSFGGLAYRWTVRGERGEKRYWVVVEPAGARGIFGPMP